MLDQSNLLWKFIQYRPFGEERERERASAYYGLIIIIIILLQFILFYVFNVQLLPSNLFTVYVNSIVLLAVGNHH